MNVAVLGTLAKKQAASNWLSGFSYRKSFTYSRASGAVENYPVKIYVGEPASGETQICACESTDDWAVIWGIVVATDTGVEGTNCVKLKATGSPGTVTYPLYGLAGDSPHLKIRYKNDGPGGCSVRVRVDASNYLSWSLMSSADWTDATLLVSEASETGSFDWTQATDLWFSISNNGSNLWVDDIRIEYPDNTCNGHCLSTFNDLRFTDSDGNLLDYWIESISGTTPNQVATVWVELDSVGTSATTYYMFYGKADASSASSGANTFILFDDFERGEAGDPIGGDWTLDSGNAIISEYRYYTGTRSAVFAGGATVAQLSIPLTAASGEYAVGMWAYKPNGGDFRPIGHGNGSKAIVIFLGDSEDWSYWNGSTIVDLGVDGSADTWFYVEIANIDFSAGTADLYENNVLIAEDVPMYTTSSNEDRTAIRGANDTGKNDYVDLFRVRNWRSVEPALGSWGSEESA